MTRAIRSYTIGAALLMIGHATAANARGTNGCDDGAPRPLVDFELGAPMERLESVRVPLFDQTDPNDSHWIAGDLADVTITYRDKVFIFPSVGNMSSTVMIVQPALDNPVMAAISFYNQCRGLTQVEVIDRAQMIIRNFRKAGFEADGASKFLFHNHYGSKDLSKLKNWKALKMAMRDRPGDLGTIGVASLTDGDAVIYLTIHNWGRKTGGSQTVYDDGTGRQYGLEIHYGSKKLLFGEHLPAQ